jgi:hypothetical protein
VPFPVTRTPAPNINSPTIPAFPNLNAYGQSAPNFPSQPTINNPFNGQNPNAAAPLAIPEANQQNSGMNFSAPAGNQSLGGNNNFNPAFNSQASQQQGGIVNPESFANQQSSPQNPDPLQPGKRLLLQ